MNWRAYLDQKREITQAQPMAVSVFFTGIGAITADLMFIAVWPQRPFKWINKRSAIWSVVTGLFYSFGTYQYVASADNNVPASIVGPISGLNVLVPPVWHVIFHRECISLTTGMGFALSLLSLFLFSGLWFETGSYKISTAVWLNFIGITLGWGIGLIVQGVAGNGVSFKQFPQVNTCMAIGYAIGSAIFACAINASDIAKPSSWIPFGVNQILALSATVCSGLALGFFSLCLCFADDFNLMVALSSLHIVIPAVLGIFVLHEPARWNVLLGLVLALTGLITLSLEATQETASPFTPAKRGIPSISSLRLGVRESTVVDKTPLLLESFFERDI